MNEIGNLCRGDTENADRRLLDAEAERIGDLLLDAAPRAVGRRCLAIGSPSKAPLFQGRLHTGIDRKP